VEKALLLVTLFGIGIGLMVPTAPEAPRPVAAAVEAAPQPLGPKPTDTPEVPRETKLDRKPNGHFYVDAEVNGGDLVNFIVDTGASSVALTTRDARRIGLPFSPSSFEVIGTGASGAVRGQLVTIDRLSIDGKEVRQVRGAVLEGLEISLLGQSYLSRIGGVEMAGDSMTLR
jgi:aspartyl protease family protein